MRVLTLAAHVLKLGHTEINTVPVQEWHVNSWCSIKKRKEKLLEDLFIDKKYL